MTVSSFGVIFAETQTFKENISDILYFNVSFYNYDIKTWFVLAFLTGFSSKVFNAFCIF